MKQDARKNSHRRKRQKRRLAMKKYSSGEEIKGGGSVTVDPHFDISRIPETF